MINFPLTVLEPIYLILQEIQGSSFFGIHEVKEGAEERILAMEELNSKFEITFLSHFLCVCRNVSCESRVIQNALFVCS